MQRVQQMDHMGCGVACLAMVTGRTYEEVRACLPRADLKTSGLDQHYSIPSQLARNGFACGTVWKSWFAEPSEAWDPPFFPGVAHIVALDTRPNGGGHYVVRLPDGTILDPAREGRYQLSDYFGVHTIFACIPVPPA